MAQFDIDDLFGGVPKPPPPPSTPPPGDVRASYAVPQPRVQPNGASDMSSYDYTTQQPYARTFAPPTAMNPQGGAAVSSAAFPGQYSGQPSQYNPPSGGQPSQYNPPNGGQPSQYNPPSGGQPSQYNLQYAYPSAQYPTNAGAHVAGTTAQPPPPAPYTYAPSSAPQTSSYTPPYSQPPTASVPPTAAVPHPTPYTASPSSPHTSYSHIPLPIAVDTSYLQSQPQGHKPAAAATAPSVTELERQHLEQIIRLRRELEKQEARDKKERRDQRKEQKDKLKSTESRSTQPPRSTSDDTTNTWACPTCTLRNPQPVTHCDACNTPAPGHVAPPDPPKRIPPTTTPPPSISPIGPWMCSTCGSQNPNGVNCRLCNTRRRAEDAIQTPSQPDGWACPRCTYRNAPTRRACELCECANPTAAPSAPMPQAPAALPTAASWACSTCTFVNATFSASCEMCGSRRGGGAGVIGPIGGGGLPLAHSGLPTTAPPPPTNTDDDDAVQWQQDSVATTCNNCNAAFGVMRRRHHCRACGFIFCYYCCNQYTSLKPGGANQRVCTNCYRQRAQ